MIHFNTETRITMDDPHCVVWATATASLWGHANDHDLDEPIRLTNEVPVRIRPHRESVVTDRPLWLKTSRPGHHASLRFDLGRGRFFEVDVHYDARTLRLGQTVEMFKC